MAFIVTGITRSKTTGNPLGSCDVYLLKYDSGTNAFTQLDSAVSDPTTGEYTLVAADADPTHCVVSFNEAVSPDVAGATVRTLVPVFVDPFVPTYYYLGF